MIVTIKKKSGAPLVVDTDKIRKFEESGSGYDITFGKDTYYFSLEETTYLLDQLFN